MAMRYRPRRVSAWLVRQDAGNIEISLRSSRLVIRTRRRVSIKPNDRVLLLNANKQFTHYTSVVDVSVSSEESDSARTTELTVDGWQPLDEPIDFDLFTSSLLFVRNLRRPKAHLRPGYRRISEEDFETIRAGQPFVAREAYEALVRALPDSMQGKFQAELALRFSSSNPDYWHLERALALIHFVESRVLSVGRMLFEIEESWGRLARSNQSMPGWVDVTFADGEGNHRADSLADQARRFGVIEPSLGADTKNLSASPLSALRNYLHSPESRDVDSRFERIFREVRA